MIKNDAVVLFRTQSKIKKSANKVLADLGLDMSTAMNIFLKRISISKTLPIKGLTENGFTPEFEEMILRESKDTKNHKTYNTLEDMYADMKNWER